MKKSNSKIKKHYDNAKITPDNKQRNREKKKMKRMAHIVFGFMSLLFIASIAIVAKISLTHVFHGVNLEELAQKSYEQSQVIEADRGTIYDSNGEALAVNINTYDMYAVIDENYKVYNEEGFYEAGYLKEEDRAKAEKILLENLGLKDDEEAVAFFDQHFETTEGYQFEFGTYGKNIDIQTKEQIEKDLEKAEIKGIYFTENSQRYYPNGDFASYVLGFSQEDDENNQQGQIGVESWVNGVLESVDGEAVVQVDNNNIPINGNQKVITEPKDGNDVYLTIDSQIQNYTQTYMDKYLKDEKYEQAFTVFMDAKTGAILGAYSVPSFDSNVRDVENYVNPFTEYCYEPGSTMKTFLLAAAMEEGKWTPDEKVPTGKRTNEEKWGDDNYIADWLYNERDLDWGEITWQEGYYYSSNTVMTYILDEIGYDTWIEYLTEVFKFGTPVESPLGISNSGCSVNPDSDFTKATTTFGQGMSTTVIQLLRAYSAITNDGKMINPYLVDKMVDKETGEEFYSAEDEQKNSGESVISEETADQMLKEMRGVVTYEVEGKEYYYQGGGSVYGEGETEVGVKTGTAERSGTSGYNGDLIHSVMMAAPYDDPQILAYTAVIEPKSSSPEDYMADYMQGIVDSTIKYLGETENVKSTTEKVDDNVYELNSYKDQNIDEAEEKLVEDGVDVIKLGKSKVTEQYPQADQMISQDQTVVLRGEGEVNSDVLKGKTYDQAVGVCNVMDWQCEYSGIGTVKSVTNKDDKYILNLEEPNEVLKPEENDE